MAKTHVATLKTRLLALAMRIATGERRILDWRVQSADATIDACEIEQGYYSLDRRMVADVTRLQKRIDKAHVNAETATMALKARDTIERPTVADRARKVRAAKLAILGTNPKLSERAAWRLAIEQIDAPPAPVNVTIADSAPTAPIPA